MPTKHSTHMIPRMVLLPLLLQPWMPRHAAVSLLVTACQPATASNMCLNQRSKQTAAARNGKGKECYTVNKLLRSNEPQANEGVQQGRQGAVHQPHSKKAEGNERAPAESQCPTRTTECKTASGSAARRSTGRLEGRSRTGLVATPGRKGQQ